jgi:hypothetical protein
MSLKMDPATVERHKAFFSREPMDRPLIGSWLFPLFIDEQFPRLAAILPRGRVTPDDIRVEPFLRDVDRLAEAYARLDDDYPFCLGAFYGVPWMEAIMGCPIHFSGESMWAEPCVADWETFSFQPPDLECNRWLQKLLELLDALVSHAGEQYCCSPTLMRGIADMCAAMRGASALPPDLLEFPVYVERLAAICADVWIEVAEAQLARIPASPDGYFVGGGCMRYWAADKGVWLQDDAIELLSPRLYREIFLPHVRRVAGRWPTAFHLHGTVLWPVDIFLEVDEIDVLQLSSDNGVDGVIETWKRIAQRKPSLAFVQPAGDEHREWEHVLTELSPTGLSLQTFSPTVEAGIARRDLVCERFQKR